MGQGIFNSKLVKTKIYINEVTESNEYYWKRKIVWAIKELAKEEIPITLYKIQIKSGFNIDSDKSKIKLIKGILETLE